MNVDVLYFASVREAVGRSRERVSPPATVVTAGALRDWLRGRGAPWADALDGGRRLRIAVDRAMADADTPLRDGAEVAFFPPVTGG